MSISRPASLPSLGRPAGFVCPPIADAEAVASLPWFGNFASDSVLFSAVVAWAIDSAPTAVAACRALYLMGEVGMGLDADMCACSLVQLAEVCADEGRAPVHYSL